MKMDSYGIQLTCSMVDITYLDISDMTHKRFANPHELRGMKN